MDGMQTETGTDASRLLDAMFKNGPSRANYLVHWSSKWSYIYVETPKVACTGIKRVLQMAELDGDESRMPEDVHARQYSPVPRVTDGPAAFERLANDPATLRFCFVRNPFSRALSCYLDKFVQNAWERNRKSPQLGLSPEVAPSFAEFLRAVQQQPEEERDIHWSLQTFLLRPNRFRYSFVGRFEDFQTDLAKVCHYLGIERYMATPKPRHATGASTAVAQYFGPEETRLVQEIYGPDFTNFGYGWSPAIV